MGIEEIEKYMRSIGNKKITLTKEGVCLCLTTSRPIKPLYQRLTNFVLEEKMENYKIRRLTPKECERLQGFPDDWTKFGKDGEKISDTQRYKMLGNAVTTNVITHIFDCWGGLYEN